MLRRRRRRVVRLGLRWWRIVLLRCLRAVLQVCLLILGLR